MSFRTQTVEPVNEDQLPWKLGKKADTASTTTGVEPTAGAKANESPHRRGDNSSSRNNRTGHSSSTSSSRRDHETSGGSNTRGNRNPTGTTGVAPGWRDRSAGRGESSSTRATSDANANSKRPAPSNSGGILERPGSASSRPRSPKQRRR